MEIKRKQYIVGALLALFVTGIAVSSVNSNDDDAASTSNYSSWQKIPLEDVENGETYTVAELEKPVLVETFAVWCPTCTRQQRAVKDYHEESGITSVSLDVDPNEDEQKIRKHIQQNGFDWRYSISPPEMSKMLADKYGNVMLNPPSAPMVLVCEEGTRKLPTGVKPASKLKEEVNRGC